MVSSVVSSDPAAEPDPQDHRESIPRFFRVMKEEQGAPKVGDASCCLGVRASDVDVRDDTVVANGKGMSVNPTLADLDEAFVPRRLAEKLKRRGCKGNNTHRIWRYGNEGFRRTPLGAHVELRPDDTPDHGNVAPIADMVLADLQAALAATGSGWTLGEP